MRLTSSGAYSRPPPVPKMPPGLVELMDGLARDVLMHSPTNLYEFCAHHMEKLLEIRDGPSRKKTLTLEQKIIKAQEKMRQKAQERRERFDREIKLQLNNGTADHDADTSFIPQEPALPGPSFRAPVHHEVDLKNESEIEISHGVPVEIAPLREVSDSSNIDKCSIPAKLNLMGGLVDGEATNNLVEAKSGNAEIILDKKYDHETESYKKLYDEQIFGKVEKEVINEEPLEQTKREEIDNMAATDTPLQTITEAFEETFVNDRAVLLPKITIGDDGLDPDSITNENQQEMQLDITNELKPEDTAENNTGKRSKIQIKPESKSNDVQNSKDMESEIIIPESTRDVTSDITSSPIEIPNDVTDKISEIIKIHSPAPTDIAGINSDDGNFQVESNNLSSKVSSDKTHSIVSSSLVIPSALLSDSHSEDSVNKPAIDMIENKQAMTKDITEDSNVSEEALRNLKENITEDSNVPLEGAARNLQENITKNSNVYEEETACNLKKNISEDANESEEKDARNSIEKNSKDLNEPEEDTARNLKENITEDSHVPEEETAHTLKEYITKNSNVSQEETSRNVKENITVDSNVSVEGAVRNLQENITEDSNMSVEGAVRNLQENSTKDSNVLKEETACNLLENITKDSNVSVEETACNLKENITEDSNVLEEETARNPKENETNFKTETGIEHIAESLAKEAETDADRGIITTGNENNIIEAESDVEHVNMSGIHNADSSTKSPNDVKIEPEIIQHALKVGDDIIDHAKHDNTENSLQKSDSTENTNEDSLSMVESDLSKADDDSTQNNSNMDLETAAVTIQKVFRSFMFKSRNSTFEDTTNDENNSLDEDNDKKEEYYAAANLNKERRPLGITRMDTVLQTVNEEKSLSLSTDDSSTLSSAATTIQAQVRGFLVRNRFNSSKTFSTNSLVNSHEVLEAEPEQHRNKTILNIHIVPEEGNYLSRDESLITSMDLSLDSSPPSSVNLHPMSCDISERRKMLKREDAVQSVSPPSNNSGKLSEDSVKEVLINENSVLENEPLPSNNSGKLSEDSVKEVLINENNVLENEPPPSNNSGKLSEDSVKEVLINENSVLENEPLPSNNSGKLSEDSVKEVLINENSVLENEPPPSNNSGKLSEDSVKEVLINGNSVLENEPTDKKTFDIDDPSKERDNEARDVISSASTTTTTVITISKSEDPVRSPRENIEAGLQRNGRSLTKLSSDESDVITAFVPSPRSSEDGLKLVHSGEFHDVVLPTKVSRNDTSAVRGE